MPTNKKLTLSFTNQDDRARIEALRKQLEAKDKNDKRYSLAETVLIAVNEHLYRIS